jgi:TRAP-type uncharacterized transport system fused permease subunit
MLYWGMVSFITPPVSLASFVAAGIAQARPMDVGMQSMRLGSIMYFVPFFFVLNPALILRGAPWEIVVVVATAALGVWLIASSLGGYLLGLGQMGAGFTGVIARVLFFSSGMAMAMPGGGELELSHIQLAALGGVLGVCGLLVGLANRRNAARA